MEQPLDDDGRRGMFHLDRPRWGSLQQEERELIRESRMKDLENIRVVSTYSIFPLILLSFIGGYFLATVMLKPLEKLNSEIRKKEADNLGNPIDFIDNGDEISELIKSFNAMVLKLSKAFESQKQFVENASHEIKTPLTIIQANLDTVLENKKVSKEELEKLLNSSKKQIFLMDNLTEDLLLLSHMTSNVDFKKEKIEVEELINSVINLFEGNSKKKDMSIAFKNQSKSVKIKGNKVLLERALKNIIENSIKYSGGDRVNIFSQIKGKDLFVNISDNGKGIAKEEKDKIFERFYRIDKGRSRKEGGSGLGLAITKEIIERHKGSVSLDSKYRNGAKFIVKLPLI